MSCEILAWQRHIGAGGRIMTDVNEEMEVIARRATRVLEGRGKHRETEKSPSAVYSYGFGMLQV